MINLAETTLEKKQIPNKSSKEDATSCLSWLMWRSSSWCSRACLCCQLSNNTSIHQIKPTRVDKLTCTPDKVDWISESHGLYNTMLKGSFYNSPWWAWDDGYGLLLGVNVTGLGPLQVHGVTFCAICQHWVGTKAWWGLGQRTPGPPKNNRQLTLGRRWGRSGTQTSAAEESCPSPHHVFNLILLSWNHCSCIIH